MQVSARPYKFCFSKNPIIYKFTVEDPGDAGCMVSVRLFIGLHGSTPVSSIIDIDLKPDADGNASVNLQDVIDSFISYTVPLNNGNAQAATNIKDFYIKFRRITDAITNPSWIDTESSYVRTVIKGGIQKLYAGIADYFILKYSDLSSQPFLTWQNDKSFIGIDEKRWISWLCTDNTGMTSIIAKFTAYDFAGDPVGDASISIPNNGADNLYHIPVGIPQIGILPLSTGQSDVWYYEVVIKELASATNYSPAYRFYVDYRKFFNSRTFHYYNSLGGIDFVRIIGETEQDSSIDFVENESFTGDIVPNVPDTQYLQSGRTRMDLFKSDVGYRHRLEDITVLKEIFTSTFIWQYFANTVLSVFVSNKSAKMPGSATRRFNLPIDWKYGFTESVYTPESAYAAVPQISCYLLVTDLVVSVASTEPDQVPTYYLDFNLYGGDADYFNIYFSLDDGATWAEVPVAYPVNSSRFEYAINTDDEIPVSTMTHKVKLVPYCSTNNPGQFAIAEYVD